MEPGEETAAATARSRRAPWRIARIGAFTLAAMLAVGVLVVWLTRERIADNIIADQLQTYDLPGSYEIESIGPARQVVRNVVIGDPGNPDLTIERVVINLRYRFGLPAIGRVELTRPRLRGTIDERGSISFGALDNALFAESDAPPGLPDLDLAINDGRARIDTPWGNIGLKVEGAGELDDGFAGTLGAIAPTVAYGDCAIERVTVYGRIGVVGGRPRFEGPLRIGEAQCPDSATALAGAQFTLGLTGDATLDGLDASLRGNAGPIGFAGGAIGATELSADAALRGGRLALRFDGDLREASAPGGGFASLALEGSLRSDTDLRAAQADVAVVGERLQLDPALFTALRRAAESAEDTLAEPLILRLAGALRREVVGARLTTEATVRRSAGGITVNVPRATLRSSAGDALLTLSRLQLRSTGRGLPQLSGNIAMGGGGLPQLRGRMERDGQGAAIFRLRMAPYEAAGSRLAFSTLEMRQSRGGAVTLRGAMQADGPLPGGRVSGLVVPLDGRIAPDGAVSMWSGCTPVRFERLGIYDVALDARRLTLCPPRGRPILRYDTRGLALAAGVAGLDLSGTLAGSPMRLASGPVGFAWPGALVARDVDLAIGEEGGAARFRVPELRGRVGSELSGTFTGADIGLDAVPLDIRATNGRWRYADSALTIDQAGFRLEDRSEPDRFNPLIARDATLTLADGGLAALAALREPGSDRVVAAVDIAHDLGSGIGRADLTVEGLVFDSTLQPVMLTDLARGIVALADGTVRGTGRIDWSPERVTSSGRFTTDDLDLAAPFGPVAGASGTIVFTDLLGLTTAPDQQIAVRSVNPGIEVEDGIVTFQLRDGTQLDLQGGSWPWLGGTLTMRRSILDFSRPEMRRYIFDVSGLDAALFIERLELSNISATGTFDGTLSVVFDEQGNGFIEDSVLVSRPPGGNLSYVGELTYEDMGAIANFAFRSLRSLDFEQMRVRIEGPLAGDVLTAITFDGVSQGEGADSNILTRRLARLPIRFNVNITAPFYQLLNNMRSLYDPDYVPDPRGIPGLLPPGAAIAPPPGAAPGEPPIQDPESEDEP